MRKVDPHKVISRAPADEILPGPAEPRCTIPLSGRYSELLAEVMERLCFLEKLFAGYDQSGKHIGNRLGGRNNRRGLDPGATEPSITVSLSHLQGILVSKIQDTLREAEDMATEFMGAKSEYLDQFHTWYWPRKRKPYDDVETLGEAVVNWQIARRGREEASGEPGLSA